MHRSAEWALVFLMAGISSALADPAAQVRPAIWSAADSPGVVSLSGTDRSQPVTISAFVIARSGLANRVWQQTWSGGSDLALPRTPFSTPGFYRLEISRGDSAPLELAVSVVAVPATRVTGVPWFGVNTHFAQRPIADDAYRILKLANVDIVRDQWQWSSIETSKGTLQSPTAPNGGPEHQRKMLLSAGMRLLHDCAYGNPAYEKGQFPVGGEAVAAFAAYCGFMARQFGAALYGSEIWNESNSIDAAARYAPLASATATVLKQAAPDAEILQGGGAGPGGGADPIYEETVYKTIGTNCCTGYSVHPYMTNPDVGYFAPGARLADPVTGQSIVNMDFVTFWLDYVDHSIHKAHASNITEIGWYSIMDGKDGVNEEKQAAYVSRALIHATKPSYCTLDGGVVSAAIAKVCSPVANATTPDLNSIFIYDFQDDGVDPANKEHHFGLVRPDLTPKMAYSAYAQAAGILRGSTFYKAFKFDALSDANASLYRAGEEDAWLILWTTEFKPEGAAGKPNELKYSHDVRTTTSVEVDAAGARITDCREWDGHACSADAAGITVTNLPVYLHIHGPISTIHVAERR